MNTFECNVHSIHHCKSLALVQEIVMTHSIVQGGSHVCFSSPTISRAFSFTETINYIAFNKKLLALAFKGKLILYALSLRDTMDCIPIHDFPFENVHFVIFDSTSTYAAACSHDIIYCIHIPSRKKITLTGHASKVTRCDFMNQVSLDGSSLWIISISEDRTFKVWDLKEKTCMYQSSILSPHALISLCLDSCRDRMCLATENGTLLFYTLINKDGTKLEPRELKRMDIYRIWDQWNDQFEDHEILNDEESISSLPSWKKNSTQKTLQQKNQSHFTDSVRIISLYHFVNFDSDDDNQDKQSHILICCSHGIIVMESLTFTTLFIFDFQRNELMTMDSFTFCMGTIPNSLRIGCVNTLCHQGMLLNLVEVAQRNALNTIGDMLHLKLDAFILQSIQNRVKGKWALKIYQECLGGLAKYGIRQWESIESASVIPESIIPYYVYSDLLDYIYYQESKVNCAIDLYLSPEDEDMHLANILSRSLSIKPKPKSLSNPMNKPVTFHNKVKSSGYTQAPIVSRMFQLPKSKKSPSKKVSTSKTNKQSAPMYPQDCDIIKHPYKRGFDIVHSSGILCVKYHSSGRYIGTASADQTARGYKLLNGHVKDFIGHDGIVHKLMWNAGRHSHYGPLMITASMDAKARVWSMEKSEPLLTFHHVKESPRLGSEKTTNKPNVFTTDIKHASFFYQDNLITILNGSKIYLYNYLIDAPDLESIRPGLNHNRYKIVKCFEDTKAQSLSSFVCANSFKSNLFFGATSDKSLNIWDVETGALVTNIQQMHSRVTHHLSIADYAFIPSGFENILLSCAVTDGIKAWDLRSKKNVMHFLGHLNRSCPIEATLSPCGRYIASGSEDKCLYIYDFRKGSILSKTSGLHVDTVMSCAFHPIIPEIACASLDGKISFVRSL